MAQRFNTEEEFLNFLKQHSYDKLQELLSGLELCYGQMLDYFDASTSNVVLQREIENFKKVIEIVKEIILEKENK